MKQYLKSLFIEEPDVRFFTLRMTKFVLAIFGIPLIITIIISLTEALTLPLELTTEGVNRFVFEIFKAPMAIVGFALPVLGFVGFNHRSEQTKKQIAVAQEQNLFTNYFKHLEEFSKHLEKNVGEQYLIKHKLRMSHDNLFPEAMLTGRFVIAPDAATRIQRFFDNSLLLIDEARKELEKTPDLRGWEKEPFTLEQLRTATELQRLCGFEVDGLPDNYIAIQITHFEYLQQTLSCLLGIISFSNDKIMTYGLNEQYSQFCYHYERFYN